MPFWSIQARRSARSDSFGDTGRVGSVPGNCMRTPLSSRISLTLGNCAACASKRSKRHLGTKCAWTSMMSCVTGELVCIGIRTTDLILVMPALVAGIHDFLLRQYQDVDGRDKPTAVRHGLCLMRCTALILLDSRSLRINWMRERIKAVRHQNIVFHELLKLIPWAVVDCLEAQHEAEHDPRALKPRPHLIAMLLAQICGLRSLRDIETNLLSHASKLYHLGGETVSKSALGTANAARSAEVFEGVLSALMAQLQRGYRRKIGDCVRLIDSTSVKLSSLSGDWATFSAGVCGAKAHIIYDPDADQPLYLMVTASNVNDITAAKAMPIEPGATYVFDLGYYDYGWWARLDEAGCRIVTRLKVNTPFEIVEDRPVPAGSSILSDRAGYLPKRLAASRHNPMSGLGREIRVVIDTGQVLRIFPHDLAASAQEIADLY